MTDRQQKTKENRFIKQAKQHRKPIQNWFSKLDPKVQSEILDAAKKWDGPLSSLALAIKSELGLKTSVQQIGTKIKDAQAQSK